MDKTITYPIKYVKYYQLEKQMEQNEKWKKDKIRQEEEEKINKETKNKNKRTASNKKKIGEVTNKKGDTKHINEG